MPSQTHPARASSAGNTRNSIVIPKKAPAGVFRKKETPPVAKKGSPVKGPAFARKSHSPVHTRRSTPQGEQSGGAIPKALESEFREMREEFVDLTEHHHKAVRNAIVKRYEKCLEYADDPHRMAELNQLAGKELEGDQVLGFVFKQTVPDHRKASKYKRRILPLWRERASLAEVRAFLREEGLQPKKEKVTRKSLKAATGRWKVKVSDDYDGPRDVGTTVKVVAKVVGGKKGEIDLQILQAEPVT